jgi:predicted acylesterase/phospholipase RssA
MTIRNDDVYDLDVLKTWTSEACVYDNHHLRRTIKQHLNFQALRANKTPCIINATDIVKWQTKQFVLNELSDDDIVSALIYSTSVPVAFPQHDGLVDGALIDNYPIYDALSDHVDRIVLISASTPEPRAIKNVADIIDVTISLLLYNQLSVAKRAVAIFNSPVDLIVVEPQSPTGIPLLGFSDLGDKIKRAGYIEWGYQLGMAKLKDLKV